MKFMKLGSKPDTFQADGKFVRYVSSDLAADITVFVDEVKFFLHKFPLLSKSKRLQKLVSGANDENSDEISLDNFPGGPRTFEICAKFCYGMTVTLNAYNVVAVRCAAEYLEMTEDVDKGNLVFKIEVFLNSSIFRTWKDSIIVLQTTKSLVTWSEGLKIVGRCVDSIASKTSVDPANITWSYTYNRKLSATDLCESFKSVPKDWWAEDLCGLEIDLYKRVMIVIKSKGRMDGAVLGEALKAYAVRWLPGSVDGLVSDDRTAKYKYLLETLVFLLPLDKFVSCSCGFLLKLLKFASLVGVDNATREDLIHRISFKLHEANVRDLLIPAPSSQSTTYDVEVVQAIVNRFLKRDTYCYPYIGKNEEAGDFVLGHGFLLHVGKIIDGYLAEIAPDPKLALTSFIDLSQSIPESARPIHDKLYRAIDIYLKEHPDLTKAERKKLCGLMDVKKLTTDASVHAAQNERLPLRVVVQVLFFEQARASSVCDTSNTATNTDEESHKAAAAAAADDVRSLTRQMSRTSVKEEKSRKKSSKNGIRLLPSRSRRIFDKLWAVGKGHAENKSSETSGSSWSPPSMAPGDTKSSASSRHRRHSSS